MQAIRSNTTFWFWVSVGIQCVLVFFVFQMLVTNGDKHVFMGSFDGMKNYFAYHNFIWQDSGDEFFHWNQMNYPFGDYILYTDNTPLLAALVKWISNHLIDLRPYSLIIFNWFYLLAIVLSTVFLFLIGKELMTTNWLIALMSVSLPWLTPQLERLLIGHFSLSLSCCLLAVLYLLIKLYRRSLNNERTIWTILELIGVVVLSSFLHMYYLIICGVLIGYFCLFWAIQQRKNRKLAYRLLGMTFLIPLSCIGIMMSIIRSIDGYFSLRKAGAGGFDFMEWQLKPDALYTERSFYTIPSVFRSSIELHYESYGYVGAFAVYGFTFFVVFFLIRKCSKRIFKAYFLENATGKLMLLLILSGIACLWISFGVYASFFNHRLRFDNWLNPFYFLVHVIDEIRQFRCMGRFNWVFFLTVNVLVFYLLDRFRQRHSSNMMTHVITAVLCMLLCVDVFDSLRHHHEHSSNGQPLTHSSELHPVEELLKGVDLDQYQAILPLPFYHTTCEDYSLTIDVEDSHCTKTYQLATVSGLPLMSSKISRMAVDHAEALLSMFVTDTMPPSIAGRLTDQPILVAFNTKPRAWDVEVLEEPAISIFEAGRDWPVRVELQRLKSAEGWVLYSWDWKQSLNEGKQSTD